jgi:hypothetical protein
MVERVLRPGALFALAMALAACGPSSSGPASSPASAGGAATASASIVGGAPVLQADVLGGYLSVLPAAVAVQDGTIHAWVVAFGRTSGDQRVFHLTSPDGLSWEARDSDLAAELGVSFSPPGPIPTSVLAEEGGWVMYLWGVPAAGDSGSEIWRATAPGPAGPWTADRDPILTPGPAGAWDAAGIVFPSAVRTDAGWLMAYSGARDSTVSAIGVATSDDGVTWTPRGSPVASPGFCGAFDDGALGQPRLISAPGGGYRLLYGGVHGQEIGVSIGLGRSEDGVTWTCATPAPLVDAGAIPGSNGIHTAAVAADGSTSPRMLVESLTASGSELWLARLQLGG